MSFDHRHLAIKVFAGVKHLMTRNDFVFGLRVPLTI